MDQTRRQGRGTVAATLFLAFALATAGAAQLTTATIRGRVTDADGSALSGALVQAVGTSTGFIRTVTAGGDGAFVLSGLPPAEYRISVSAAGYQAQSETLQVLVGQTLDARFVLTPEKVIHEEITVVGNQAVDMRTSAAATNITPLQIENLPQDNRNFLNFAALAPGVRLSTDPLRKTISADAQPAEQTNVFIDGVSFKNDVLQGGVSGQDSSRGNPFPQNAVQEFRVITQNYSAQYEKASSAIITAVTRSGGNSIKGEAFYYYQPKRWVSELPKNFQFSTLTTNTDYKRDQPGFSIGGPIVRDKLHYFASYERVREDATTPVRLGNSAFEGQFGQFEGTFPSPFTSNLGFSKLSWQPSGNQLVDLSGTYRREHETRDFGGATSFQSATDLRNSVYDTTLRHQWNSDQRLNQASLSWQQYTWNPTPLNPDLVGLNYEGVVRLGGNSTTQKFQQQRIELRDDFSLGTFEARGTHDLQVGGNVDFMHYSVDKSLNGNPQFNFRNDPASGFTFAQPFEALYGFGNPNLSVNNREVGVYVQDKWIPSQRFAVDLGLRWDYETHQLDQNYITPPGIVAALTGVIPDSYFSNGDNRSADTNEWQPRLGFSWDVRGDGESILFGGAGRYYDRLFLNSTLDERYRLQFPVYRIEFSPDGRPGTIQWDPSYLSKAGLDALIASGATNPEIYLLNNNTKTPYSDQWNIGFRQALGNWIGSLSYNRVRGYHGFTWLSASGICCSALVPGYGNVIISDPEGKDYWYEGIYLTFDRPYSSRWSAHITWAHATAEQNGNDLFSLDYPSAADYPRHTVPGTEKDRITASGIFGLPWGVRLSALLSLGSGAATNVLDFSQGFSLEDRLQTRPFERSIYPDKTWGFADRTFDLSVEKEIPIGGVSVSVVGQIFNAFNWASYGCLNNFIPPEGNPSLGEPGCVTNLPRREQVGFKVKF